jgi:cytidylate kinase
MDHVAMLKKYLKARGRMNADMDVGYPFVTISRQAGAGGHVLARNIVRAVEKSLPGDMGEGWEVFDHKLCLLIAQDPDLSASFNTLLAEGYRSEISITIEEILIGESRQYRTMKRLFEVVRGLCSIGKVVIVGRAGNFVAADLPLHARVRLVASEEWRTRNMMELLDVSKAEALKALKKQDAERAQLIYDFFNQDINDPLNYDCLLNAECVSSPDMAELVTGLVKQRVERAAAD